MYRVRFTRTTTVFAGLLAGLVSTAAWAQGGPFDAGNMTFGLSGGGGSHTFNIGAQYGYFPVDGLRLSGSFQYRYQDFTVGEGHNLEPGLGVRYYLQIPGAPLALFPSVDVSLIYFQYKNGNALPSNSYTYGSVAPGGGVFVRMGPNFGLEVSAAAVFYFGEDPALNRSGVVPTDAQFRWGFGLAYFF